MYLLFFGHVTFFFFRTVNRPSIDSSSKPQGSCTVLYVYHYFLVWIFCELGSIRNLLFFLPSSHTIVPTIVIYSFSNWKGLCVWLVRNMIHPAERDA